MRNLTGEDENDKHGTGVKNNTAMTKAAEIWTKKTKISIRQIC